MFVVVWADEGIEANTTTVSETIVKAARRKAMACLEIIFILQDCAKLEIRICRIFLGKVNMSSEN